jgi:hypothetical protein
MKVDITKEVHINTVEDWFFAAPPKGKENQWKDNYSAKELAKFATSSEFPVFLQQIIKSMGCKVCDVTCIPEADTPLPFSYRGPRNHDLLVVGKDFVIGIEAKVNEPYSNTLSQEYEQGSKDKKARIDWMKKLLFSENDNTINELKYQLFSGTCGTLLEAARRNKSKCMFLVLSFDVEGNGGNKTNNEDFAKFCDKIGLDKAHKTIIDIFDPDEENFEDRTIECYIVKKIISHVKQYNIT